MKWGESRGCGHLLEVRSGNANFKIHMSLRFEAFRSQIYVIVEDRAKVRAAQSRMPDSLRSRQTHQNIDRSEPPLTARNVVRKRLH